MVQVLLHLLEADPHLTDYVTLLENLHGLKEGKAVQVPIYDFKTSSRTGYRSVTTKLLKIGISDILP